MEALVQHEDSPCPWGGASNAAPLVSIVMACFNEAPTIRPLYDSLTQAMARQGRSYEMVFVNDCSTDASWEELLGIHARDHRVVLVDLARNSGQWPALTAGIEQARGEAIAFLDCDLQLSPADLLPLLDRYDEGYDLVGGRRMQRNDSGMRRAMSAFGNRLLRGITKGEMQDIGCILKVFRGSFLRAFQFGPMMPFRPLQVIAVIDRLVEVPVSHQARVHGTSHWGGRTLLRNFSLAAMDLLQGRLQRAGMIIVGIGLGGVALGAAMRTLGAEGSLGWGMASIHLGMGLVLLDLVILGLVTRRVKPAYVVRRVLRHGECDQA